jgi:hypothetical protein
MSIKQQVSGAKFRVQGFKGQLQKIDVRGQS